MDHEEHTRELAYKFLEAIPHEKYFGLKELKEFIWKNSKGFTFSEADFYDTVAYLLNKGELKPTVIQPHYHAIIGGEYRQILLSQVIDEVVRPRY